MALTAVATVLRDWWLTNRPASNFGLNPVGVYDALVSDLQVDDFLIGARARVVSTGTTTGGLRTLTLERANSGTFTVAWVATSTVKIAR